MRLARVLGAIGRALISAGVIVLLFVAYQLWGTGIQNAQAQADLEDDFFELLDSDLAAEAELVTQVVQGDSAVDEETDPSESETADEAEGDGAADEAPEPDETTTEGDGVDVSDVEVSAELLAVLYPEAGERLARIDIPDIGVDQIVVEGVSVEDLRKGPGHYPSTPNPGQAGNAAIAGHRTTYGAPFHRIDELDPGDPIFVTTIQGTFEYRVTENEGPDGLRGHFIVSPSDTWVLGQTDGENMLTLTACHPKYSARQRIIVQAELVGEPAPTIPRDEANELDPVEVERRTTELATEAGLSEGEDVEQVISEEVAVDDDPSLATADEVADSAELTGLGADSGAGDAELTGLDAGTDAPESDSAVSEASSDPAETAVDRPTADDGSTDAAEEIELTAGQTPFGGDEDFGEGLNGDRTKIRPAIMWGLAAGAIWLAAWFVGDRLDRKWTLYLLFVVPFAPVLWSCFVNIDQALPSY